MKVGMILECCEDGADEKVYLYLAGLLRSDLEITPMPLDSKGKLKQKCAQTVKGLLCIDKCEKVLIIWDYHPSQWGDEGTQNRKNNRKMCPIEDRNLIETILKEAKSEDEEKLFTDEELARVEYLCVQHELETLFLFDTQALSDYISKLADRPCTVKNVTKPGFRDRPKIVLRGIFEEHLGRTHTYNDRIDAEKLIKSIDIGKLKRCSPYQKFKKRIQGF